MSIDLLRSNIKKEKQILFQIVKLIQIFSRSQNPREKEKLKRIILAYYQQIRILNNSIPNLLDRISFAKELPSESVKSKPVKEEKLVSVSYENQGEDELVIINRGDKNKYLKELQISTNYLRNLKDRKEIVKEDFENVYKKPNPFIRISNKFFAQTARNLIAKGKFRNLGEHLKKGNFIFLLHSYVSVLFFGTLLATLFSILLSVALFALTFSFHSFWVLAFPIVVYFSILYYPSSEVSSLQQNINYELPFVTIQMSAIAGADIEPSNIFRIIALSKEYPYISKEAKKLMNQINLYGYDFVTALRNIAHASPSKSWADLLNGISTIIRSGGNLSKYLDKKSETLLFEYRLKREKATKAAETFMDIYISIVIAAPLLMMLLLILMSVSNILPLSFMVLTILMVSLVMVINVIFLAFLQLNQKKF
jgi:pilus assembly protein TadC